MFTISQQSKKKKYKKKRRRNKNRNREEIINELQEGHKEINDFEMKWERSRRGHKYYRQRMHKGKMEALKMCGDCMDCCYYKLVSADWCHFEICYKDHNEDIRFNELNLTRCEDYQENRLIRYYYHHIYNELLDFKRWIYWKLHPFKKRKMDTAHEEIKDYMEEKRRKSRTIQRNNIKKR